MKKRLFLAISLMILAFGFVSCNMNIEPTRPKMVCIENKDYQSAALIKYDGKMYSCVSEAPGNKGCIIIGFVPEPGCKYYLWFFFNKETGSHATWSQPDVTEEMFTNYDDDLLYIVIENYKYKVN